MLSVVFPFYVVINFIRVLSKLVSIVYVWYLRICTGYIASHAGVIYAKCIFASPGALPAQVRARSSSHISHRGIVLIISARCVLGLAVPSTSLCLPVSTPLSRSV